jgi:hypothetical protein
MLGSDLIGMPEMPPFKMLIGEQVKWVKLKEKKVDRNSWEKSVMQYDDTLNNCLHLIKNIQTYCNLLQSPGSQYKLLEHSPILLSIREPVVLIDIGIMILENKMDYRFAIDLPDPNNHLAMRAFNKVITTEDL